MISMMRSRWWASVLAETTDEAKYLSDIVAGQQNKESTGWTKEYLTTIENAKKILENYYANTASNNQSNRLCSPSAQSIRRRTEQEGDGL